MAAVKIQTVTGAVSPDDLGVTLVHEHVLYGYPGWEGDRTVAPLDRERIVGTAITMFKGLKALGVNCVIDATPVDGGRDVEVLREVSERSEILIVCSTGCYFEGEGAPAYWKFRSALADVGEEIHELFLREATEGILKTGIRAGVVKVGSSKGQITDYEKWMFAAAARVQREAGIPIITHTQDGTMGPRQAELLIEMGADPRRIQIGHMSDNLDLNYQKDTLRYGVFVAWDRMGLQGFAGCPMDAERYPALAELIRQGHGNQLLISHDSVLTFLGRPLSIPVAALPLIANWQPAHLFQNIIPALKQQGVSDAQIRAIVVENPRRLFTGE
jgi:phosphotriesterase-related protein